MKFQPLPENVLRWLTEERLLMPDTIACVGLCYATVQGKSYVVFPHERDGDAILSCKMRLAPPHVPTKTDKWMLHPKGRKRSIYGDQFWEKEAECVFIAEGELDCLLLIQAGFNAVTSTTGVQSGLDACVEIVPHGAEVVLAYDNDKAGLATREKHIQKIREVRPDIRLRYLAWPQGFEKDVTDFFLLCKQQGTDPVAALIRLVTYADDAKKEKQKQEKETQAQIVVRAVQDANIQLFHDELEDAYARIPVKEHMEVLKIEGRKFSHWMRRHLWSRMKKIVSSETLKSATAMLEAAAFFDGERIPLSNRIGIKDGIIRYDLSDAQWRCVEIRPDGWLIAEPPTLFRRYGHQEAQVEPQREGSVEALLRFVNITDASEQLLFLVCLVSFFIPGFPHPILNFYGSHGSAKTTIFKILCRLVDPSKTGILSLPRDIGDLIQQLSHRWFAMYDNISSLMETHSDALCRAITGEGASKRKLYTNDEDVIFSFQCCIALNGINLAAQKSDLLDRSILFRLERIPEEERREEREVLAEFEQQRPHILGAIFDTVAEAMRLRESVVLKRKPRMADFTVWGCAIAMALDFTQDEFLRAYAANIGQQNEEVIEASPVAVAVRVFVEERMREKAEWRGTATALLAELQDIANFSSGKIQRSSLPKIPQHLTKRLNDVKSNLGAFGIFIDTEHRTGKSREVIIQKIVTSDTTSKTMNHSGKGNDDETTIGDMSPSEVSSLFAAQAEAEEAVGVDDDDELHTPSSSGNPLKQMGFFRQS
jgi:hypothetical protein